MVSTKFRALALSGLLALVFSASPLWAGLGGDAASVQADQVHMQGTQRTTATSDYSVHEIQTASGTVVREYVSANGKVFAVAWQGPWRPDLRQLLGSYFDRYLQAAKARTDARAARSPLHIEQPGLVVHSEGHVRAFVGRAYIPELLPSDIKVEAIR
jgi:Protein of unknown function (DUF2844)